MKRILVTIVLLTMSLNLSAQTSQKFNYDLPPIISIETFFGDPQISGAQVSPDGKYISFRKPYNGTMNIWVKKFDESFESAKPVTADTKRPVTSYFWSRDGKYILFVQDLGGDENYRVYSVDPNGTLNPSTGVPAAKDLTPLEKVRIYILSVPKSDPNNIIIGVNDRDPSFHDIYKLNIISGEKTLIIKNTEKIAGFIADDEGTIRLAVDTKDDGSQVLYNYQNGKFNEIYKVSSIESFNFEGFSKDKNIAYISSNKGDVDLTQLYKINLLNGETEFQEKDPENEVDFEGAIFSEREEKLIATIYVGDRTRYYFKDKEWENSYNLLKSKLSDGEVRPVSMTDDEKIWLVSVSSDVDPGSVYSFNRITGDINLLYKSRPDLPSEHLARMEPIKYKARDGVLIPAYVVIPKGVDPKRLPTIIFPHGGPWARDYWGYNSYAQFLANRGYAVLIPNFRGSTGFGKNFLNLGNKQWGTGTMQHDLSDGVRYMIDRGISDPVKIAIMGGSYGGYATLAGLAFTPELYAAGVDIVGPSNIVTLLKTIPPYWESFRKIMAVRLGDIDNPDDVKLLESQSPLFFASNIKAPLLVIQGANDPRVKQAESDQIVSTLRDLGRSVEYILAPDEGHGFAGKLNRLAMFARIDQFLSDKLGGRKQESYSPDIVGRLNLLTVDISKVKVSTGSGDALEKAKTAPVPEINIGKLKPVKLSYSMTLKIQGQDMKMTATREYKANDADQIEIVDNMSTPMGNVIDKTIVDSKNMLPVSVSKKMGDTEYLNLIYNKMNVTGVLKGQMGETKVDFKYDKPFFAEGGNFETVISLLNLNQGYIDYLRVFDESTSTIKFIKIEVMGSEDITVAGKQYSAYSLNITDLSENTTNTYWVSNDENSVIVKSLIKLPANMGGSVMTVELTDIK